MVIKFLANIAGIIILITNLFTYICDVQVWWLGWRLCCASWRYQHTTMLGLSFFLPFMVSISCCQAPAEYHLYQARSVSSMKPHLYNSVRMILHWPNGLTTNVHHMCYFWSKLSGNFRNLFALLVAQQVSEILPPSKYFTSWCSAQSLPSRDLILSLLRSTKIISIFYKNLSAR